MASLNTIHPDDIVEVDRNGRRGICHVTAKADGELTLKPITPGFGYRTCTARQIVGHWRKTKNGRKVAQQK